MNHECKGCKTFFLGEGCISGLKPHRSKTQQCPCLDCLIKVLCVEDCEDFKEYSKITYPTYKNLSKSRCLL